jgi:hypothetical protein
VSDEAPDFLDLEDVLELHALQLARYGGAAGVRDRGLLESAVARHRRPSMGRLSTTGCSPWALRTSSTSCRTSLR